jgi:hypothetical protein
MNFEKKLALLRSLKKAGITSAKALSEFASDPRKLVNSGMSMDQIKAVLDLSEQVGKANPFFDWFLAEA